MRWPRVTIESLKAETRNALVGGPFGSDLSTRHYVEDGVPVIRGGNLPDDQSFKDDDFVFVSEEKADLLGANNAYPGDVIFTQRGTLGQVGLIPIESRFPRYVVSQSQMKLTVNPAKADPRFVYYFFRHPDTVQTVKNRAITSGVPHINLGILREFEMPLPPLNAQREIVATLANYDELTDNNRQRMALLEDAARLLYREWFVRLRFPGHEHVRLSAGIPEGWERVPFEDALVLQRGFDLPEREWQEGDFPICCSTGIVGYHKEAKAKGPGVFTGRSGSLGVVNYIESDYWPHNTALWVREFKKVTPLFALFLLREMRLEQYNGGASVPTLDRKAVHRVPTLIPPRRFITLFDEQIAPMFSQLRNLREQNQKLRAARDLLLPRLMSGEIAV